MTSLFNHFKKSKSNADKSKNEKLMSEFQHSMNPFLHAKLEWNERYGHFETEKKLWQLISLGLLLAVVICLIGLVALALKSKIVPYVIEKDKLGAPIVIQRLDETTNLDTKIVAYQLAEWVKGVRTVTTDGKLKKEWMMSAQTISSQLAWQKLQNYWTENPPEKLAQMMNISVSIDSVLPFNNTASWQVNWTETALKNGETVGSTKWTSIFTIGTHSVKQESEFLSNPTGIFIKDFDWSMVN